jgi:hypothetical protein
MDRIVFAERRKVRGFFLQFRCSRENRPAPTQKAAVLGQIARFHGAASASS